MLTSPTLSPLRPRACHARAAPPALCLAAHRGHCLRAAKTKVDHANAGNSPMKFSAENLRSVVYTTATVVLYTLDR